MAIWLKTREAAEHLAAVDPRMKSLISHVGPCTIAAPKGQPLYHALARSIVYQQLSGKAAATIFGRVLDIFGGALPEPEKIIRTRDATFRAAGLSGAKTAAIKDLARKSLAGVVPSPQKIRHLDDAEIIRRLTEIRGIGVWTVQMLLIFRLGRLDVMPNTDLGVRKGYAKVYAGDVARLPPPLELLAGSEIWKPYRSVAAWYLWRSLEIDGEGL